MCYEPIQDIEEPRCAAKKVQNVKNKKNFEDVPNLSKYKARLQIPDEEEESNNQKPLSVRIALLVHPEGFGCE